MIDRSPPPARPSKQSERVDACGPHCASSLAHARTKPQIAARMLTAALLGAGYALSARCLVDAAAALQRRESVSQPGGKVTRRTASTSILLAVQPHHHHTLTGSLLNDMFRATGGLALLAEFHAAIPSACCMCMSRRALHLTSACHPIAQTVPHKLPLPQQPPPGTTPLQPRCLLLPAAAPACLPQCRSALWTC